MLVKVKEFFKCLDEIKKEQLIGFDCEATGLHPFKKGGGRAFCVTIHTLKKGYYFNFYTGKDHLGNEFNKDTWLSQTCMHHIGKVLDDSKKTVFISNAKYDMALMLLADAGYDTSKWQCTIHCVLAVGRVEQNDRPLLNLAILGAEIGYNKLNIVENYIKEHKLWDWEKIPSKKTRNKQMHFELVPQHVIVPYALTDALVHLKVGIYQISRIKEISQEVPKKKLKDPYQVMNMERELTKVFFNMEKRGVKLDIPFTSIALGKTLKKKDDLIAHFKKIAGAEFNDHANTLGPIFKGLGLRFGLTDKGNPSFKKEHLIGVQNPIAKCILDIRKASKDVTYYQNFLYFMDEEGILHGNMKQHAAVTGRISVTDPPLQTLAKVEEGDDIYEDDYLIRRCIVPRENTFFGMLDYDQMEYSLMLDYAGEMELIELIKQGMNVHDATAEMASVKRKDAKTLNFMIIYGGGVAKLCLALFKPSISEADLKWVEKMYRWENKSIDTISTLTKLAPEVIKYNIEELNKAYDLKAKYFGKLPAVENLLTNIKDLASNRGYIFNWYGRRYNFSRSTSYKAPNGLIQGGCAEIMKLAILEVAKFLKPYKSQILLQIHDELLMEMVNEEKHLLPVIKTIMEGIYPYKHLPLTVGIDISTKSWQDKEKYIA